MDFIKGIPCTRCQHDLIWAIVNQMTKLAHFLVKTSDTAKDYAKLYICKLVQIYGVPLSIILFQGTHSTILFEIILKDLGIKLKVNTTFHP